MSRRTEDHEEANTGTDATSTDISPSSQIGWFRYYFTEDRWEWSDEVARMHGYEPASVTPTTELVLAHKHPDDRADVAARLDHTRQTGQAFSSRHRICDTHGRVHPVIVVGHQLRNDTGEVLGSDGFYIDLTTDIDAAQTRISHEVEEIADRRSAIDQAKGMLMLVYNLDDAEAFNLLRWRSQNTNTKLRDLAHQIAADFLSVPHNGQLPAQSVYDNLLMTAHQRAAQHH
ncbi:PAS fold-3 domain protein [Mycolicibacterium rhodesiae JS60]|nr:PAS fold-3 domain protein [Mycolicibacterium rhodesiae JS60]